MWGQTVIEEVDSSPVVAPDLDGFPYQFECYEVFDLDVPQHAAPAAPAPAPPVPETLDAADETGCYQTFDARPPPICSRCHNYANVLCAACEVCSDCRVEPGVCSHKPKDRVYMQVPRKYRKY